MLLFFYLDGDADCESVEKSLLRNERVATYLDGFVKVRINPEAGPENQDLARKYRLRAYPAVLIGTPGMGEFRKIVTFSGKGGERTTVEPETFLDSCRSLLAFLAQNQVFRGIQAQRGGRPREALEHFNRALEMDPENMEAYKGRGMVRYERGNLSGALEDFNSWVGMVESSPEANFYMAMVNRDLGKSAEAIPCLDRIIAIDPGYRRGEALVMRARAYESLGEVTQAAEDARAACELGNADGCDLLRKLAPSGTS
jgi:tetratricopeptide (TPR) repeat protein